MLVEPEGSVISKYVLSVYVAPGQGELSVALATRLCAGIVAARETETTLHKTAERS